MEGRKMCSRILGKLNSVEAAGAGLVLVLLCVVCSRRLPTPCRQP